MTGHPLLAAFLLTVFVVVLAAIILAACVVGARRQRRRDEADPWGPQIWAPGPTGPDGIPKSIMVYDCGPQMKPILTRRGRKKLREVLIEEWLEEDVEPPAAVGAAEYDAV